MDLGFGWEEEIRVLKVKEVVVYVVAIGEKKNKANFENYERQMRTLTRSYSSPSDNLSKGPNSLPPHDSAPTNTQ